MGGWAYFRILHENRYDLAAQRKEEANWHNWAPLTTIRELRLLDLQPIMNLVLV